MEVITITNQKGGVAKSTTAWNLAYNLNTLHNKKVLLVDMDAQSNLSFYAGVDLLNVEHSLYDVFKGKANINDAIINIKNGLDIVVGSIDLASADREFTSLGREKLLQKALKQLDNNYDYVLVDTPPVLGVICENAMSCSTGLIIPMNCSVFALQGVNQLYGFIEDIRDNVNPDLSIKGILITRVNEVTNVHKEIATQFENIAEYMGTKVYKTLIRSTIQVEESAMQRESLTGSKPNATATKDYIEFTKEFLEN